MNQADKMRALAAQSTVSQEKSEYTKTLALIRKAAKKPAYSVRVAMTYPSTVDRLRGEGFQVEAIPEAEQEFTVGWAVASNTEASKNGKVDEASGGGAHAPGQRKVAGKRVRTNPSK